MLSSQIPSAVMFPVAFPVPRAFPASASGDSHIPGAAQLPMGIQLLALSRSPGMFSFLLGSAVPRASQLLRIFQTLRSPHGLLSSQSLGMLSSLRVPALQKSLWNSSSHGIPSGWGDQAALLWLSLDFCHFCSCCCNKKWERHWLPLPPAPGGILPFLPCSGAARTGLGRCFEDKQHNFGQIQDVDEQSTATAGSPPQTLMEWDGTGRAQHWSPQNLG